MIADVLYALILSRHLDYDCKHAFLYPDRLRLVCNRCMTSRRATGHSLWRCFCCWSSSSSYSCGGRNLGIWCSPDM